MQALAVEILAAAAADAQRARARGGLANLADDGVEGGIHGANGNRCAARAPSSGTLFIQ